jgi:hypothetical protein
VSGLFVVALLTSAGNLPRDRIVDGWLLFVGALVSLALVQATRRASGAGRESVFERALERPRRAALRPSELARLEREVALATTSSFDVHFRLRPVLREVAEHRVEARGVRFGSEASRRLLGEEVWEVVRPDRPQPDDRFGPGIPLADLHRLVTRLASI